MVLTPQDDVRVKYTEAALLAAPNVHAEAVGVLHPGDAFRVVRQEGLFYAVALADGREAFVFARNLAGEGLPPEALPSASVTNLAPTPRRWPLQTLLRRLAGRLR
jgi:hypothetical protein